jgi:predicted DNA-binding transcriptional regulator YafY
VQRELDPLGLVAKGKAWYLVAGVSGELRSYRVSRISHAETMEERVSVPVDFDLAEYWLKSAASFKSSLPNYLAIFRVSPAVYSRLRYAGRFARIGDVIETDADGWCKVSVGFDVEEMACEFAMSFGASLQVIEPLSLRKKVIEAAQKLLAAYDKVDGGQHTEFEEAGARTRPDS